jgi:ribosomal protein L11 methyltransferase
MTRRAYWKISILTTPEAEEGTTDLLARVVGEPACSYTDLETGATTVAAYLKHKPKRFPVLRKALHAGLANLAACRVSTKPGRITLSKVPARNWAEAWKRHFKPIQLGDALLVRPSWSQQRPRPGQRLLVLDPGLSFGTGHHPTTLFCLRQIVACRNSSPRRSFLDLGTGSGILALSAARLGYGPVEALDIDPESVRIARSNATRNRLAQSIHFRQADLARLPKRPARRYSLVCANLITPLLLKHRERIIGRIAPGGRLVVAGILREEMPALQSAYEAAGLQRVAVQSEKEWCSAAFAWK